MRGFIFLKTLAAFAAVCVLSSCTSTPKPLPQLAEDVRSSLGTVGVITSGSAVGGEVAGPVGVGGQAVVGVLEGGAIGSASGAGTGALLGLLCGPGAFVCVPLGAITGGFVGLLGGGTYGGIVKADSAIPESAAAEIKMTLVRAIADHDLQAELRGRVLQRIGSTGKGVDLGVGATARVMLPDSDSSIRPAVGTVLEMSLTQLAFSGKGGMDPNLALVITARARLIRIADQRVLWNAEQVRYESSAAAFSLWTVRDSSLLKIEIDNGLETLASRIGEALFVAPGPVARPL